MSQTTIGGGIHVQAKDRGRDVHPAVLVVIGLALLMVAMVGAGLWLLRLHTLNGQERILNTLTSALTNELGRGLNSVELALMTTRDDLRAGKLLPKQAEAAAMLQARASVLPLVRNLWIVDEHGRFLAASRLSASPAADSFLPQLNSLPDKAIALSLPYFDPALNQTVIAMAMHVVGIDGENFGWVMAEIPAQSLVSTFPKAASGSAVLMEMLRSDGVRLAGNAGMRKPSPVSLARSDDSSQFLVQERQLEQFPAKLVLTLDLRGELAHWRNIVQVAAAITAIILIVLAALLVRLLRAERIHFHTQRALAASRERSSLANAAAQEGSWDWTPSSNEVYLSPRMKEIMGLACATEVDPASISLDAWCAALHPDDAVALKTALYGQAEPMSSLIDLQLRARRADAQCHWVRLRGKATMDNSGSIIRVAGVAFDITEERERAAHTQRIRAQVARTRRLESLGTLAGGVAHDFNNTLAAVIGYSEIARLNLTDSKAQARYLDQILQAGLRGKSIVERILAFSRSSSGAGAVFPVQPVVQQVLDLLAAGMNTDIRLELHIEKQELLVRGDSTQLFEAMMNLCTNALQAIHRQGVLKIGLRQCHVDNEKWLSHGRLAIGEYVELSVADSGEGIPPNVMEHLFEPFFTTRGAGTGTGLGLAVVHGVIEDLGGSIDVSSTSGQGATFTLYVPRAEGKTTEQKNEMAGSAVVSQGQTILVVDDERALVDLAEESLAQLGYEPIGFTCASAALEEFRNNPLRYDLILTDEVMPGMSGTQLARRVHEIRPNIPIMLVSGYGGSQLLQRARGAGICCVLTKPIRYDDFAKNVAVALGA